MEKIIKTEEFVRFFRNIDYDKILSNAEPCLEYIKKQAGKGSKETTRMMLELYFVMMSDKTSKFNKLIIGSALAFQLLPNDLIPREEDGVHRRWMKFLQIGQNRQTNLQY